jgi:hypothetical protein
MRCRETAPASALADARGFDITRHVRSIAQDMAARLPELSHVDVERIVFAFCQTRKRVRHGLFASLTPLRFAAGEPTGVKRGRRYGVQPVIDGQGREMLYILRVYLPRFMDLDFREKLITVLHELWHISPAFDGDLRRHNGRCYIHTGSQAHYDAEMGELADRWLALGPPPSLYAFLRHSFAELHALSGPIYGVKIAQPKLIPI